MLHGIAVVSWPLIGQAVPAHLQTNRWSDFAQIWWVNTLLASPGLINFWSCSTEFLTFYWPLIGWAGFAHLQTKYLSYLPKIWWANSLWPPLASLNFGHAPLNSHHFLASDWSNSFLAFANLNGWPYKPLFDINEHFIKWIDHTQ